MISVLAGRAERALRAAGLMLILAGGPASPGANAAYGEYLAAECATCHSPDGINGTIPPLHALTYDSFIAALKEYRDGTRANGAMQAVARSLGDAEIEALAVYFTGRS